MSKIKKILQFALKLDRNIKKSLQIIFDILAIFLALSVAMFLKTGTTEFLNENRFFLSFFLLLLPTLYIFARMGLYLAFIRYMSTEIAAHVALGSAISASLIVFSKFIIAPFIPWSVPIIYGALLFIAVTGLRFSLRTMLRNINPTLSKHIAIYGAGNVGAQLLQWLSSSSIYRVKMILDDNPQLQGLQIYGLRVISFEEATKKFEALRIDIILLAVPNTSSVMKRNIITLINNHAIQVKIMPSVANLIDVSPKITELNDIAIEDLLDRERVNPLPQLLNKNITGKIVLVTGAGGSIGSELCRQIIQLEPKQLIMIDVSELAIYNIISKLEQEYTQSSFKIIPIIGSLQDQGFVNAVFNQYKIDTIYHAAAYKHVPLMEQNIMQAVKNNTIATMILAQEAIRNEVTTFTLISTDKAVNPTNVMGASKRLAERICQAMNQEQLITRFSMVRFGNVLGSSGSVVPLFQKQISEGGPITLTHPDVTRYFMTIGEAVHLVIQSNSLSKGGEVFVLDMGVPVKIKNLAFKMVHLSGLKPYLETDDSNNKGDIAIRITGLRPGEKLYEELSYNNNLVGTLHPRIRTATEKPMSMKTIKNIIDQLKKLIVNNDKAGLLKYLIDNAEFTSNEISIDKTVNKFSNQNTNEDKIIKIMTNSKL